MIKNNFNVKVIHHFIIFRKSVGLFRDKQLNQLLIKLNWNK